MEPQPKAKATGKPKRAKGATVAKKPKIKTEESSESQPTLLQKHGASKNPRKKAGKLSEVSTPLLPTGDEVSSRTQGDESEALLLDEQDEITIEEQQQVKRSLASTQTSSPSFTFRLRFFNYNMGNRADVHMDEVGNGFAKHGPVSMLAPRINFTQLMLVGANEESCETITSSAPVTPSSCISSADTFSSPDEQMGKRKGFNFSFGVFSHGIRDFRRRSVSYGAALRRQRANVDVAFGVMSESKMNLDEWEQLKGKVAEHFNVYSSSATHMLSEVGLIGGMKSFMANKFSGDLQTLLMCRGSFEEIDNGRIYCSYDPSSQGMGKGNPMKSFIGRTFDAACGALRFVFLGSHFPMNLVSRLMEDATKSEDDVLQELKCSVAKLLRKIILHLHQKEILNTGTMVILQGDLNSRTIRHEGKYVDLLSETLQDTRLQQYISAELPFDLRGEWRELVSLDPGDLPITYRFSPTSSFTGDSIRLQEIYGGLENEQLNYRQVLEKMKSDGSLEEWGLYNPKLDADGNKFKPSRLPACTERVVYYAPTSLLWRSDWETTTGYDVNYAQTGSDHKPVMVEATLRVGTRALRETNRVSFGGLDNFIDRRRHSSESVVPDDFEQRFIAMKTGGNLEHEVDSEDSDACEVVHVAPRRQTRRSAAKRRASKPSKSVPPPKTAKA